MVDLLKVGVMLHLDTDWHGSGGIRDVPVLPGVQVTDDLDWMPTVSATVTVPGTDWPIDARESPFAQLSLSREVGEWWPNVLVVRKAVRSRSAGTTTLTLESADVLLVGTRHNVRTAPAALNLQQLAEEVIDYLDPGHRIFGGVLAVDRLPGAPPAPARWSQPIGDLVTERPQWRPGQAATDYLAALGAVYGAQWGMGGTYLAAYDGAPNEHTITGTDLLDFEHATDGADFYNRAYVRDPETGVMLGSLSVPSASPLSQTNAGRRVWVHEAPFADPALMQRALSRGETWQLTVRLSPQIAAGDLVHVNAYPYAVLSERVNVVRHTSDGTTVLTINPAEIGEPT